jgi:hypothetical protein
MAGEQLTGGRRRAIAVLQKFGTVRVSNQTTELAGGSVYWQTARWLLLQDYAEPFGVEQLRITKKGREA